jgi:DNA-binding transcriptional ArsR family regulator
MREKELEKILKALANRRRLAILAHLKRTQEMSVGNIAKKINLSFAATSRHLVIMERSGILEKEQRNLAVFYRLRKPRLAFIEKLLTEL